MSHYKLHSENHNSFTIQHPDGNQFMVAKHALDDEAISRIRKMPPVKMAGGGVVPDLESNGSSSPQPDSLDQIMKDTGADSAPVTTQPDNAPPFTNGTFDFKKWALQSQDAPVSAKADSLKSQNDANAAQVQFQNTDTLKKIQDAKAYNEQAAKAGLPLMPVPADPTHVEQSRTPADVPHGGAPAQTQESGPAPQPGFMDQLAEIQKQEAAGIQGMAQAQKQAGAETAKGWQDYNTAIQAQQKAYQERIAAIDKEQEGIKQDIMNGKVDPSRIWNDTGTGNKVLAGIGILLSGIGSGLTGQPNMAMQVIDKAIDRDIDAQKANLNKKQTLYSMNLQRYKNAEMADAATRLQLNTTLQAQLASTAARSGSAQAMAQAQIQLGQLKERAIPLQMQLAQMHMNAQSLGQGGGMAGFPVGGEPMAMLGDEKYQAKRVVVGDRAYQTATPDDAKKVKELQAGYEPVRNMVQELDKMGPEALVPGTEQNLRAQAIRAWLTPTLNKMHGLSRLSEEDIHLMQEQIKDPTKWSQLVNGGAKNSQFMRNLNDDLESEYKTRIIGFKGMNTIPSRKVGW